MFGLLWKMLPWTLLFKILYGHIFSVLLGEEFLGHMVSMFEKWLHCFPKGPHHFAFLPAMSEGSASFTSSSIFLIVYGFDDHFKEWWSSISLCFWFSFSQWLMIWSFFSRILWSFMFHPWRNAGTSSLFIFEFFVVEPYMSRILISYQDMTCKSSLPSFGLSFHFLDSVFWNMRVLNFDEVQFTYFFFCWL
jgi:hypothetical protein